jgi:hypothetical protein
MRSFLWFLFGLVVAVSGQALAQSDMKTDVYGRSLQGIYGTQAPLKQQGGVWVDGYGNSAGDVRGLGIQPGQSGYQDSSGQLHYPPASSHRSPC